MAFPFPYMTLAIDKLNGRGFSDNVCRERLPKKTKMIYAYGMFHKCSSLTFYFPLPEVNHIIY